MFSKPCLNIIQLEYRVQPEWSSYVNTVTYNNGGVCRWGAEPETDVWPVEQVFI